MDDVGFARIRSKEDQALFGGHNTQEMKRRLDIKDNRPLEDFLPTLTIDLVIEYYIVIST